MSKIKVNYKIRFRIENRIRCRIIELAKKKNHPNIGTFSNRCCSTYFVYKSVLNYELYPSIDILKLLISEV